MKASFEALEQIDRLTSAELPLLDDDEWVDVRRHRDYTRDASAETKALVWVSDEDALKAAEEDEENDEAPAPVGGYRVDQGRFLRHQFEYMALDWNLYEPEDEQGERVALRFTKENRDKFVRLHGVHLTAQMMIRGGGIAPVKKLEGKVDANGEKLTFQKKPGIPARGQRGKTAVAGTDTA